jgi:hypothetical protein
MEDVMSLFDKDGIGQMDKENEDKRSHIYALTKSVLQLPLRGSRSPSTDVNFT